MGSEFDGDYAPIAWTEKEAADVGTLKSRSGFEFGEAAFEFPLLLSPFAGFQKSGASCGGSVGAQLAVRARGDRGSEFVGSGPQAGAWQKNVFDAGADHLL